jgi:hypothetical protein
MNAIGTPEANTAGRGGLLLYRNTSILMKLVSYRRNRGKPG